MSESNNKITETESERSEHRKYGQISEKLWPWLYLNENKMFISQGLIICIVYYFWINTFFEKPYYNDIKII
jgi:hypothetical protein